MTDRPTVLVLHSGHRNDLVYQEGLAAGFATLDCDTIGISVRDADAVEVAVRALLEQPEAFLCVVSISFYGLQLKIGSKPLHECVDVPLVMWLFDQPALFCKPSEYQLPDRLDNIALAALDQAHIDYWHRYICADTPAVELNLGIGKHPALPAQPLDLDAYRERAKVAVLPINLTHFSMTLDNVGARIDGLEPVPAKVVWQAVETAARDLAMAPFRAVESAARDLGFGLGRETMATLTKLTDAYVKLWRRHFLVRQLADLPVRFLGEGFPEFEKFGRRKRFAGTTMPAIFDDYRGARLVINLGPAFPRYVHERIMQGLDAGAAVMSDLNPGVAETFADGAELIGFDLSDGDAAAKLADWLERPDDAFATVVAARRKMDGSDIHNVNARRLFDLVSQLADARRSDTGRRHLSLG